MTSWKKSGTIKNDKMSNYQPVSLDGRGGMRVWSNGKAGANGGSNGDWYTQSGPRWGKMGAPSVAMTRAQMGGFVRTSAVCRTADGTYHAMLMLGDDYWNNTTGFEPYYTTSSNGTSWERPRRLNLPSDVGFGSSMALVVEDGAGARRFKMWHDGVAGKRLAFFYSADATSWSFASQDAWPFTSDAPVFASAARSPEGIHLLASPRWQVNSLRHIFSSDDGNSWSTVHQTVEAGSGDYKGMNIVYDPQDRRLHGLVNGREHYTRASAP